MSAHIVYRDMLNNCIFYKWSLKFRNARKVILLGTLKLPVANIDIELKFIRLQLQDGEYIYEVHSKGVRRFSKEYVRTHPQKMEALWYEVSKLLPNPLY